MKKLDLSSTTPSVGAYLKSGTYDFLQTANKEILFSLIRYITGNQYNSSKVYILYGCEITSISGVTSISTGVVFYNGEIYYAASGSWTTGATRYFKITQTPQTLTGLDPITLTDSSTINVHIDSTVTISASSTGSIDNINNAIRLLNIHRTPIVNSQYTSIYFDKNDILIADFQGTSYNALTFLYYFTGANVGCKKTIIFKPDQTSIALSFPKSQTVVRSDLARTYTATYVVVSATTGADSPFMKIEFEYLGVDSYGNKFVSVNIFR